MRVGQGQKRKRAVGGKNLYRLIAVRCVAFKRAHQCPGPIIMRQRAAAGVAPPAFGAARAIDQ